MNIDSLFWKDKYDRQDTGWDLGSVSEPLKNYFNQLTNKSLKILIPGCGNAYEAEYLWKNGFKNVFIADYAEQPLLNFKQRNPDFPPNQLLLTDFFEITEKFDLVIEQTFFCALDPKYRANYTQKMAEILNDGGKLVGLLFNDTLNTDKPPFGGNKEEYTGYFETYFNFKTFDSCYNSIKPRLGRELFIIFEKK